MAEPERSLDLETALDELYGVDPRQFVGTRGELVARLRDAGDAEAARALRSARRPTTAAWAMNQLSRRVPEVVERFLSRSRELADVQRSAVSGASTDIRDATRAQRAALAETTDAALAMLGSDPPDAYRTQVTDTLRAASTDDIAAEALQHGRLTREVSGTAGFPGEDGPTSPPSRARSKRREEASSERDTRRERARAELTAAQAAVDDAEQAQVTAEQAARDARARVERLADELEHARVEARSTDRRLKAARAAGAAASKKLARARHALDEDRRDI